MTRNSTIIYTITDEAPALATRSLLPIVRAFLAPAGVAVETRDISLAGRILATFSDRLPEPQKAPDALAELGRLAQEPEANIIKLPNISASIPQLKAAIAELQALGYALPDYPDEPATDEERATKARYDKVKGSAVNPVLREGNSDRRAPKAVKEYARQNPPPMKAWSPEATTHVATMSSGDFRHNEKSVTIARATRARIEHVARGGEVTVLKAELPLQEGEILDATYMSKEALIGFLADEVADARKSGILFSLHLKATMMKVSDPIIFGHAVRVFFKDFLARHADLIERLGFDANNGLGDLVARLGQLGADERAAIEADLRREILTGTAIAMVDFGKGITNLHVPSDVIIDASMPPMIRDGGCMWNAAGKLQHVKAVIPDSSYAPVYQAAIDSCKREGAFDPARMGSVANVGLMAQKAEEYGSHDKTFEVAEAGRIRIVDGDGCVLLEHEVEAGDVWRACQVKDAPVRDWVKLAVKRARATGSPTIFWLDRKRAHDHELIVKVETYLAEHDTAGLKIRILSPAEACAESCAAIRRGEDVISVTGNVLRDYLTDLFPILEVGTSAKMLSIVPLMKGGGLFETGAGGSAPKHVQQFVEEGHLRWDSLGEFLALAVSLEHYGEYCHEARAGVMAQALDAATTKLLLEDRSPKRGAGELDNRGSHYYLARYWAQALAEQTADAKLAAHFAPVAAALAENEGKILAEIAAAEGKPVGIGGYYRPDDALADRAMRPSATMNAIIAEI